MARSSARPRGAPGLGLHGAVSSPVRADPASLSRICRLHTWSWPPEAVGGGGVGVEAQAADRLHSEDGAVTEKRLTAACRQQGGCGVEPHDGGSEVAFEASTRVLLGHGTAGHGDQLWAFSICNGSMSSAHKLRVVADGEQLRLASRKMLRLAACVSL